MLLTILLAGTAALLAEQPSVPAPADAAQAPPAEAPAADVAGADIIVTGLRRNRDDVLSGTSVVSGLELTRDLRPTIGETLSHQPGVSATSFGPNASRPVLRGFQGERVRVLTDGIGSLDVSSSSADHAVAINPLTAERIEVLRGPAALLFGSEAIGGVVNVVDSRIPRRVPDEGAHVEGVLTYGSAADERSANVKVDVPVGGHFVLHADGNYSKTADLAIGGFVLTPELRAEAAASADPAVRALAGLKGKLPNTAAETSDVALGAAWIDGGNNVGVSVNRYDSLYGVPIRYALEPGEEAEAPRIDVKQTRADARAEIALGGGLAESLRFRAGYSDYRHDELEANGAIGTTFLTKGEEARLELVQHDRGGFGGGAGIQYFHRGMNVIGDEKYLPKNATSQFGVFALENYVHGPLRAELGARYERQTLHADADSDLGNSELRRAYSAVSGSLGGSYEVAKGVRIGINGSHTQRAPSGDELFANGPHAGTQAFEIGDADLAKEKSWGLEGTLAVAGDGYGLTASVFRSWFDNYIFERRTGEIRQGLPVFQISQAPARYSGLELEGNVRLAELGPVTLALDAVADYIRATIRSNGPAPRIPPLRLLGGIEAKSDPLDARVEVEWVDAQERTAPFETPTDGFTTVNASVSWRPLRAHKEVSLTLSANNIFDVDARRHASFLKDYAPLAGRDVRLSARFAF
ncbi:MAG: TonB-dependent receptor [Alphaproteobacteria bacterium]|nr:TonB-dependent receptor [Alphaproteobacteria bacterium]MBV9372420.1 TonB-dependent receptor [Alphaproteobacteria bacterium]MBV9899480.1 TonB-dependent receptor [Alphaproteobacteria bacterium]